MITRNDKNYILLGEYREYLSCDCIDKLETVQSQPFEAIILEFLNTLSNSGLANHSIKLKVGCHIMLLRNLDLVEGLCNSTRLMVTRLVDHVIEVKLMPRNNIDNLVYIPRMLMFPSQSP